MSPMELEQKLGGKLTLDLCANCQSLWLDAHESQQLTLGATIALFRAIVAVAPSERKPLPPSLVCPRCEGPLMLTHDLALDTHFTYYACASGHGRFTPFVQFLREKRFIRELDAAELERLKASVKTIRCSGCGAAVDLERSTACSYCGAPIMALDPDAVAKTIRELSVAEKGRLATIPDSDRVADAIVAAAQAERAYADKYRHAVFGGFDLVTFGLATFAALIE
jgi:hypothetical protein